MALPSFLLHHHHTPAFFTHYLRDARQAFGTKQDPSPLQPATFKTPQIKVMRQTEEAHTDSRTVLTLSSNDISGEEEHWQSMLSSGAGLPPSTFWKGCIHRKGPVESITPAGKPQAELASRTVSQLREGKTILPRNYRGWRMPEGSQPPPHHHPQLVGSP